MRVLLSSTFVAAAILLGSQSAHAQDVCPGNMAPTIAALQDCVSHALSIGHIDNAGIANSLLSKLDAAERAQERNKPSVAISILEAFIQEVEAQGGKHINEAHADHMVEHARMVIAALGG